MGRQGNGKTHAALEEQSNGAADSPVPSYSMLPGSVRHIVAVELCERFSFYGMRAILALYLSEAIGLSENGATEGIHLFIVAAYISPLLGAFISDSYLGKYSTIIYLSLIYAGGGWILAVSALLRPQIAVLVAAAGLFFIALGTGGIKPCVSAFGGDQIELTLPPTAMRDEVLRLFFSAFYFAINLGSVFSTIFTPMVRSAFTYFWAFSLPAALMVVALGVFLLGTPQYVHHPPSGNLLTNVMRIIIHAIRPNSSSSSPSDSEEGSEQPLHKRRSKRQILAPGAVVERHWLDASIPRFGSEAVEEVKLLLRVLVIFLPIPIFWSLFDQQASRWTFQAQKMDGRVGHFLIEPDQMQSWNALLVLIFIPLFDRVVYPGLERAGVSILPIRRMVAGMVGAALSFVLSALVQMRIDSCPTTLPCVNILWQLPQYAVMTAGEILISITGLEFAYSHAPASMTSVVLSFWSLTVAVGNIFTVLVVGVIAPHLTRAQEFIFFSVATLMASLLLMYVGRNFTYVTSAPLEEGVAEEVEALMH